MTELKKVPYQFTNEVKDGKHVLTLSGLIRKRYWSDDKCIDAALVRSALDGITSEIVIYLNSEGGDVFQGIEIYNYLKNHSSKITVEVTGIAASAATFITSGADMVIMNTGTTLMIHEASMYAWGNKGDIQKALNALEAIDESIISVYAEKTGQSAEQIAKWMNEEKYFTAEEAVKYGFADSTKTDNQNQDTEDMKAMIREAVALAMVDYAAAKPGTGVSQKSLINKLRKEVNKYDDTEQ